MSGIRIACTAIAKRINAGRINQAGNAFLGNPIDVTSDCLKAVIDLVEPGRLVIVNENGAPKYEISVRLVAGAVA